MLLKNKTRGWTGDWGSLVVVSFKLSSSFFMEIPGSICRIEKITTYA